MGGRNRATGIGLTTQYPGKTSGVNKPSRKLKMPKKVKTKPRAADRSWSQY